MAYIATAPEPSFSGQLQRSLSVPASYSSVIMESSNLANSSTLLASFSDKFLVDSSQASPFTPGSYAAMTSASSYHSVGAALSGWQTMQLNDVAENAFQIGPTVPSSGASANELLAQSDISVNGSPSSLQLAGSSSCSSELLGSTMMSGDWQLLLDSSNGFRSSNSSTSNSTQVLESMTGHTSRLGANSMMTGGWRSGAGHSVDSKVMSLNTRTWSSREQECGISVEPTKGALALHGIGLATSHCLEQISSDPAFAERAAKFSPFSNGKYSQVSQPLPFVTSETGKSRSRVGSTLRTQPASESKISRSASSRSSSGARLNFAASMSQKLETSTNDPLDTHEAALERGAQDPVVELATADQEMKEPGACVVEEQVVGVDGATDRDMDLKEGDEGTQEDISCIMQAACRESSDDTGNKRKEIHSDAGGIESNTATYTFTEIKVDESDQADPGAKRYKGSTTGYCKGLLESREDVIYNCSFKLAERSSSENSGDSSSPSRAGNMTMKENVKPSTEPASKQDYVHVRARRGQATDSHSLAERVRREKISERMKYLQELVPGCSKVTGKAVMLDEIINYVQSLQQQVEFLSMKLAAVNPQLDFNLDSILKKEILQSGVSSSVLGSDPTSTFGLHQPPLTSHITGGPDFQSQLGTLDGHLCRTISTPTSIPFVPNLDAYRDDDATQMSIGWDGELQSSLQMEFGQTNWATSSSLLEGFNNCQFPALGHMKVEL